MSNPIHPLSIQGSIWCSACKGKGEVSYVAWNGKASVIKCPICRGTGLFTYKGKVNLPSKE